MRLLTILTVLLASAVSRADALADAGYVLFHVDRFDGNGRTCATCHTRTGTINPAQAQALYAADPDAPLFRSIDSDDGVGSSYTRLLRDATIRVHIPLPPNCTLQDDPTAREVVLLRGVPTFLNSGLETELMADGREGANLAHQAGSAVGSHFQPGRQPSQFELDAIAAFERTQFSSEAIGAFAVGGPAPVLPTGTTASEKRGARFFDETSPLGFCSQCHGGPMLNTTSALNPLQAPGGRFSTDFTSELNLAGNPVHTYLFTMPDGSVLPMTYPDPGRALITGNPCEVPGVCVVHPGSANTLFKIPTLWNIKNTAPYFHDNSAKTLEDVMRQYQIFFHITAVGTNNPTLELSDQDLVDIVAFMKLL